MTKTVALAAVMVAAQIGTAPAAYEAKDSEPVTFNLAQKAAYCERLKTTYLAQISLNTATAASVAQLQTTYFRASEARALAVAGGCPLAPFVDVFLERVGPAPTGKE